jgi:crossover junction endodeoxyribonuclease RuvC
MGIDPGTTRTGYGVLEVGPGGRLYAVALGDIDLRKVEGHYAKLRVIFERVSRLIDGYRPDEVALESPFFGDNVQSMLKLGRAQGVAMAAALSRGIDVCEYAPRRVKQAITGRGGAAKEQVAAMLGSMLGIEYDPRRLDATDGMAVALCHHFATSSVIGRAASSVSGASGVSAAGVSGSGALAAGGSGSGASSASADALKKSGKSASWETFLQQNPDRIMSK